MELLSIFIEIVQITVVSVGVVAFFVAALFVGFFLAASPALIVWVVVILFKREGG